MHLGEGDSSLYMTTLLLVAMGSQDWRLCDRYALPYMELIKEESGCLNNKTTKLSGMLCLHHLFARGL